MQKFGTKTMCLKKIKYMYIALKLLQSGFRGKGKLRQKLYFDMLDHSIFLIMIIAR